MLFRFFILGLLLLLSSQLSAQKNVSVYDVLNDYSNNHQLTLLFSKLDLSKDSLSKTEAQEAIRDIQSIRSQLLRFKLSADVVGNQLVIFPIKRKLINISGIVLDKQTGERLPGASIYVKGRQQGVISNGYGYFNLLDVIQGERIYVSYIGYPLDSFKVSKGIYNYNIALKPSYQLKVIEVTANRKDNLSVPRTGKILSSIELLPVSLTEGSQDVNAWIMQKSGVQALPGGFRGFSVRGAHNSQNLILLDDAPLYLPSHGWGYKSSVPGESLKSIEFYNNFGPAKYGDRVGGVLHLRLKDGSSNHFMSTFSAGLTDVYGSIEGPINKGSYYIGARHSLTGLWLGALRPTQSNTSSIPNINFDYYDVSAKINYPIGTKHQLYASVFSGRDDYKDKGELDYQGEFAINSIKDFSDRRWSNHTLSLRHNWALKTNSFLTTTATLSQFEFSSKDVFELTERNLKTQPLFSFANTILQSQLTDFGLKQDLEHAFNTQLKSNFGWDYAFRQTQIIAHSINVARRLSPLTRGEETSSSALLPNTMNFSLYATLDYTHSKFFDIQTGLRFVNQFGGEEVFSGILPRVNFNYKPFTNFRLFGNYGRAKQFMHNIETSNPGLPQGLWVNSVYGLKPQSSNAFNLGASFEIKGLPIFISSYYNTIDNLPRFKLSFAGLALANWTNIVEVGKARNMGIEIGGELPISIGKLTFSYTLSRAERIFESKKLPEVERFALDRLHQANVSCQLNLSAKWMLGAVVRGGSGAPGRLPTRNPFDLNLPRTNVPLTNYWTYDGKQVQLDPVFSFDLGFQYRNEENWGIQKISLGIKQFFWKKNPLFVNIKGNSEGQNGATIYEYTQISMFPFIPILRYNTTIW